MGANPDTKLQVNFGGQGRPLVNVYAEDEAELAGLLSGLADVVSLIGDTDKLFGAVSTVQQVLGGSAQPQATQGQAQPAQAAGGLPKPDQAEFCAHGEMRWKTGIAKNTGNQYGLWECPTGEDPVRWPKKSR